MTAEVYLPYPVLFILTVALHVVGDIADRSQNILLHNRLEHFS